MSRAYTVRNYAQTVSLYGKNACFLLALPQILKHLKLRRRHYLPEIHVNVQRHCLNSI